MEVLYRTQQVDQFDGRRISGTVVPYGQVATVNDGAGEFRERFAPGAFRRSLEQRGDKTKLLVNHDSMRRLPIGKVDSIAESTQGLVAEFAVSKTRDGDEALELVRDGVLDSFSVGFRPIRSKTVGGVVERVEAALKEVSVVAFPAYAAATIAGVRSDSSSRFLEVDVARRRLGLLLPKGSPR